VDGPTSSLDTSHFLQSSFREKLLEHVFVGELLQCLWCANRRDIEVLRAETDASGYDLVLECNGVLRHVQFKSSHRDASTRGVTVHVNLAKKPSGCVVWIVFDSGTLELGPFLWFGAPPGQPLPPLGDRIARHTKGDSTGRKAPRPNLRVVGRNQFKELPSIDDVAIELFGAPQ
jgi:hypothetical protein